MIQMEHDGVFAGLKAANIFNGTDYEHANKPKAITASVFKDMEKYGLTTIPLL